MSVTADPTTGNRGRSKSRDRMPKSTRRQEREDSNRRAYRVVADSQMNADARVILNACTQLRELLSRFSDTYDAESVRTLLVAHGLSDYELLEYWNDHGERLLGDLRGLLWTVGVVEGLIHPLALVQHAIERPPARDE